MICYRKATLEDLNRIWDYQMALDPDEPRNQRWRDSYISRNATNRAATYVAIINGEPVAEVTLDYHAEAYGKPEKRSYLADGSSTAYVTALRIRKHYEGLGIASGLMRYLEIAAAEKGFIRLTIGVGAEESRNLAIYLHWGYNQFLLEDRNEGDLVLFYAKQL